MFKSYWRNGFTVGIAVGLFAGIILVLALDWTIDPDASAQANCKSTADNCANNSEGLPHGWYWLRRFFAMEDSLAQWIMMIFTVAAAGLLLLTLRATQKMAAGTREIGEKQVRAYIGVDGVEFASKSGGHRTAEDGIKAQILIKNYGSTPANSCRLRRNEQIIGTEIQDEIQIDVAVAHREWGARFSLGAQGVLSITIDNILSAEEFHILMYQEAHSFFFGEIEYLDVFGREHVTDFCIRVENFGTDRMRAFPFSNHERTT